MVDQTVVYKGFCGQVYPSFIRHANGGTLAHLVANTLTRKAHLERKTSVDYVDHAAHFLYSDHKITQVLKKARKERFVEYGEPVHPFSDQTIEALVGRFSPDQDLRLVGIADEDTYEGIMRIMQTEYNDNMNIDEDILLRSIDVIEEKIGTFPEELISKTASSLQNAATRAQIVLIAQYKLSVDSEYISHLDATDGQKLLYRDISKAISGIDLEGQDNIVARLASDRSLVQTALSNPTQMEVVFEELAEISGYRNTQFVRNLRQSQTREQLFSRTYDDTFVNRYDVAKDVVEYFESGTLVVQKQENNGTKIYEVTGPKEALRGLNTLFREIRKKDSF